MALREDYFFFFLGLRPASWVGRYGGPQAVVAPAQWLGYMIIIFHILYAYTSGCYIIIIYAYVE